ncbi:MAG: NAD(P)H-hydrate dehydratase [Pyrinomonadaceae bacterium]
MHKVVTAAQMREIDRQSTEQFGLPSLQLMENAAQAVTDSVMMLAGSGSFRVLVFCGPGNNGGDGAAIARQLAEAGGEVCVVLAKPRAETKGDARTNIDAIFQMSDAVTDDALVELYECTDEEGWASFVATGIGSHPNFIVDALFGTGLTRPLGGHYEAICNYINELGGSESNNAPWVISVDVPSGLNSDSNELMGTSVQAFTTVTFTAPKLANVLPPASRQSETLTVAPIGSPAILVDMADSRLFLTSESDVQDWMVSTRYRAGSFKNSHGHVLVIAGSRDYAGAPVLCGDAAMCSGAGLVTVATPASAMPAVSARLMPEIITATLAETDSGAVSLDAIHQVEKLAQRANVIAVGPGLSSTGEPTREFMRWLVEHRQRPLVIDADGLNALSPWPEGLRGSDELPLILTPHLGEMRRLLGAEVGERPWVAASEFAQTHNVVLVLKGERTLVAIPDGQVFINPTGNPGVGTAGAGDTMTGVIAGFVAQEVATNREKPRLGEAVRAAIYVCGEAADIAVEDLGMRGMTASAIRSYLSQAMLDLARGTEKPWQ